jgi:hypothetical protein
VRCQECRRRLGASARTNASGITNTHAYCIQHLALTTVPINRVYAVSGCVYVHVYI